MGRGGRGLRADGVVSRGDCGSRDVWGVEVEQHNLRNSEK